MEQTARRFQCAGFSLVCRNITMRHFLVSALLLTAVLPAAAQSTLQAGDSVPSLNLKDQHDKPAGIPNGTRQIIFAADNAGASLVTVYLDAQKPSWLRDTQRVYLADIHKMPSLITKMFAMPKLREKPYTIVLGREAADLAMFPRQKECVAVIPVQDGKLGGASYACTAETLKTATTP